MKKNEKKYLILRGEERIVINESPFKFLGLKKKNFNITSKVRSMEILEQELISGKGFFSFLPNGQLISNLIEDFITNYLENTFDAIEIKTPFVYKMQTDKKLLSPFEERIYLVRSDDSPLMILKPNADIGLFHLTSEILITQEILPLRIYEKSNCFRYLLNGEIDGIKKMRGFFLFDCHSLLL